MEYDLEGWESDVCSTVLLWEDTESIETKYALGRRRFKKNLTPLKLEQEFANEREKYDWLYNNRFEMDGVFLGESISGLARIGVGPFSPLVVKENNEVSFAMGIFIKYLISIENSFGVYAFFDIGDEESITVEEFLGEEMFSSLMATEF
jgi:hypothetical protein